MIRRAHNVICIQFRRQHGGDAGLQLDSTRAPVHLVDDVRLVLVGFDQLHHRLDHFVHWRCSICARQLANLWAPHLKTIHGSKDAIILILG